MSFSFDNVKDCIKWIETQKRFTPKVSLDKMRSICAFFDNPESKVKFIHVAGTNGKGSTVSFIKSILITAGYKVASFTSPYITCFNERIGYMNHFISDENLLEITNYISFKYDDLVAFIHDTPTFFELTTLIAFLYFAKCNPDFVVLEVGLGGRLDATNVVMPILTIITNVHYDHMEVLGNTLEEIALNKLGIVKQGIPLITIDNPDLNELFKNVCNNYNSSLMIVKKEYNDVQFLSKYMTFTYRDYYITSNLMGFHQCENISIAINAIEMLNNYGYTDVSKSNICQGIKNTSWPARLQILNQNPLIIVDGAHNIDGICRLVEFLKAIKNGRIINVVFAVSKNKAHKAMLEELLTIADKITLTKFTYKRSATTELLVSEVQSEKITVTDNINNAIIEVKEQATEDQVYVFCGSLYFASEVLLIYQNE